MEGEGVASDVHRIVAGTLYRTIVRPPPPVYHPQDQDYHYGVYYEEQMNSAGFGGFFPFLGRLIKLAVVACLLLTLSSGSYLLFYTWVMPSMKANETLHFDYTSSARPWLLLNRKSSSWKPTRDLSPWGTIDLFAKKSCWDAAIDEVNPIPLTEERILDSAQAYFIEVDLLLPDSVVNQNFGMFGVVVELQSSHGTLLATSRRSVRYPHQSRWISNVGKTICLLPLLIGAMEEARTVRIPAFRHFVESREAPLVSAINGWYVVPALFSSLIGLVLSMTRF